MKSDTPNCACSFKEWLVPPVLIPIFLILGLAIWVAIRPHIG